MRAPTEVTGLATFDKRVILFGSEGNAKIFSSLTNPDGLDRQLMRKVNMPIAVVEAVDPICLNMKLVETCNCHPNCGNSELIEVPDHISEMFDDELVTGGDEKRVLVTLGQFSIIRLERDTQLVVPVVDFCLPDKECISSTEEPCELFRRIKFPVDEFFPPNVVDSNDFRDLQHSCCK